MFGELMITVKNEHEEPVPFPDFNLFGLHGFALFMDVPHALQERSGRVETETSQTKRPNFQRFIFGQFGHLCYVNLEFVENTLYFFFFNSA